MEFGSDTCCDPPCQTPNNYLKSRIKLLGELAPHYYQYKSRKKGVKRGKYPTRMPSSISVGETFSPNPTTNCNTKRKKPIKK
jgi:hypothetical protein